MDQLDAVAPRRQCVARDRERVLVAIEADDPRRAALEERACVAAQADGAVNEESALFGPQMVQDLRRHDGNVGRQMPNSDSARASSSVYGSRCSFVRNRS